MNTVKTASPIDENTARELLMHTTYLNSGALYNIAHYGFGWALRCGEGLAVCSSQTFPMLHISECGEEDYKGLVAGILKSGKPIGIASIPAPWMADGIRKIAEYLGKKAGEPLGCNKFYYEPTKGKPVVPTLKEGFTLRPLEQSDLPYIMRYSRYADLDGIAYYSACIANGAALGIVNKGELAAWSFRHDDGSIGCLNTREHYRRQGLAQAVTAAMVGEVLNVGDVPCVQIEPTNIASTALATQMGFVQNGWCGWIWIE